MSHTYIQGSEAPVPEQVLLLVVAVIGGGVEFADLGMGTEAACDAIEGDPDGGLLAPRGGPAGSGGPALAGEALVLAYLNRIIQIIVVGKNAFFTHLVA